MGFVQKHSNINFHYSTKSVKINYHILINSKNPVFGLFQVQFLKHKIFSRKSSCRTQLHMGFQHHVKIKKKNNPTIPRKHPDRQEVGKTDRLYFIGPFKLPAGTLSQDPSSYWGSTKTNHFDHEGVFLKKLVLSCF